MLFFTHNILFNAVTYWGGKPQILYNSLAGIFVKIYSSSFLLLESEEYIVLYNVFPFSSIGVKLSPTVDTERAVTGSFFTLGLEFTFLITLNIFSHMDFTSNSTHPGLGKTKSYSA